MPSSLPAQAAAVAFVAPGLKIRLDGRRNKHQTAVVVVNLKQVISEVSLTLCDITAGVFSRVDALLL